MPDLTYTVRFENCQVTVEAEPLVDMDDQIAQESASSRAEYEEIAELRRLSEELAQPEPLYFTGI